MSQIPPSNPIRACIFDVDGLLINSEDIYHEIYNQVLADHGRPPLSYGVKALQASRGDPGLTAILSSSSLPLSTTQFRALTSPFLPRFSTTTPLPGVHSLLTRLSTTYPHLSLAIASSSSRELFTTKTAHIPIISATIAGVKSVFGDDEAMKGKGKKPAPDVFLVALGQVNAEIGREGEGGREGDGGRGDVKGEGRLEDEEGNGGGQVNESVEGPITPEECLVFEDSIAGVEAARRAGMRVVWVPPPKLLDLCQGWLDEVLAGRMLQEADQVGEVRPRASEVFPKGVVRRSEDGWATCIDSLENFDYGVLNR